MPIRFLQVIEKKGITSFEENAWWSMHFCFPLVCLVITWFSSNITNKNTLRVSVTCMILIEGDPPDYQIYYKFLLRKKVLVFGK